MPSPFPGMDPFLEHPEVFPDLHDTLIALMKMAIQPQLPHPYYAAIGARIWVESQSDLSDRMFAFTRMRLGSPQGTRAQRR